MAARHRLALGIVLPLTAIGGLAAHLAAFRLLGASGGHHQHHGYLVHWRLCLAVCLAAAGIAVAACAAASVRRRAPLALPVWLFALVPPVGFTVQEHLERLLYGGAVPYAAALELTFAVGLLLQVPLALAAFFLVRLVLSAAVALVRILRSARPRLVPSPPRLATAAGALLLLPSPLAGGHGQRAPPPLLASR